MLHLTEAYKMPLHPHLLTFPIQSNIHQASSLILNIVYLLPICAYKYKRHVSVCHQKYEIILTSTVINIVRFHLLIIHIMCYECEKGRSHHSHTVGLVFIMANLI